jgi:hypothetical protein
MTSASYREHYSAFLATCRLVQPGKKISPPPPVEKGRISADVIWGKKDEKRDREKQKKCKTKERKRNEKGKIKVKGVG